MQLLPRKKRQIARWLLKKRPQLNDSPPKRLQRKKLQLCGWHHRLPKRKNQPREPKPIKPLQTKRQLKELLPEPLLKKPQHWLQIEPLLQNAQLKRRARYQRPKRLHHLL
jgi:hypothetical protein